MAGFKQERLEGVTGVPEVSAEDPVVALLGLPAPGGRCPDLGVYQARPDNVPLDCRSPACKQARTPDGATVAAQSSLAAMPQFQALLDAFASTVLSTSFTGTSCCQSFAAAAVVFGPVLEAPSGGVCESGGSCLRYFLGRVCCMLHAALQLLIAGRTPSTAKQCALGNVFRCSMA